MKIANSVTIYGKSTFVDSSIYLSTDPSIYITIDASELSFSDKVNGAKKLSSIAEKIQANWDETDASADSYINNKPTTLEEIDPSVYGEVELTSTDIDFLDARERYVTLTSNVTYTFSNIEGGRSVGLYATGDYSISFPTYVFQKGDTYDGTIWNYLIIHIIRHTGGNEQAIVEIINIT